MNQTSLKEKSYSCDSLQSINDKVNQPELLKVAIYNNLKIKITRNRVVGDGCIWEEISPMNTFRVSQSVSVLSSFKCRSMMVVLKKTWRNSISFKKETEKIVLLQVKGLIQIILKFRTEKYLCTFLSSNTILCTKYCVAVL